MKRNLIHNFFQSQAGVAFLELSMVLVVLIASSGYFWNLWSTQELKLNMISTATSILNNSKLTRVPIFSTNVSGVTIPYPSNSTQLTSGLKRLAELMIQDIKKASPVSAGANNLVCAVRLSYLTLEINPNQADPQGVVKAIPPIAPVIIQTAGSIPPSTQLISMINQKETEYYNRSVSKKLLGPAIQTQLGQTQATPTYVYFQWHAFYVWGCEGQSIFMGISPLDSKMVDIVVPER